MRMLVDEARRERLRAEARLAGRDKPVGRRNAYWRAYYAANKDRIREQRQRRRVAA